VIPRRPSTGSRSARETGRHARASLRRLAVDRGPGDGWSEVRGRAATGLVLVPVAAGVSSAGSRRPSGAPARARVIASSPEPRRRSTTPEDGDFRGVTRRERRRNAPRARRRRAVRCRLWHRARRESSSPIEESLAAPSACPVRIKRRVPSSRASAATTRLARLTGRCASSPGRARPPSCRAQHSSNGGRCILLT